MKVARWHWLLTSARRENFEVLDVCTAAASGGHLELLRWLVREAGCHPLDVTVSQAAARHGHLATLQWLVKEPGCPWDEDTCSAAAREGHLEAQQVDVLTPSTCLSSSCTSLQHLDIFTTLAHPPCIWTSQPQVQVLTASAHRYNRLVLSITNLPPFSLLSFTLSWNLTEN